MSDLSTNFTAAEQRFIDEFTVHALRGGLPLSAARMYAHLMVCQPAEQTAQDIEKALQLSAGGVNTSIKLLLALGIISRVAIAGKRAHYYAIKPDNFIHAVQHRLESYKAIADLARNVDSTTSGNSRLRAMSHIYGSAAQQLDILLKEIHTDTSA